MTKHQSVQLCRPTAEEVRTVLQPLAERPAAGLHLGVDVVHRLGGPAQRAQPLQDGVLLLPVEDGGEGPRVDRPVSGLGHLLQGHPVHPADVQLGVPEDVVDEGHVGPHVGLLPHVQLSTETDSFAVDERHDRLQLRHNEGSGSDEGNLARGTHVLGVGPHLDGEVETGHVEEGLHGQTVGVVGEEDLLQLVRLVELHV